MLGPFDERTLKNTAHEKFNKIRGRIAIILEIKGVI